MPDLIPVLKKDEIDKLVSEVAQKISSDYQDRELILIAVLKGAFMFLSDLARRLTIPAQIDFLRVASYGANSSSSGKIQFTKEIEVNIRDKDVLVIEDIIDTGLSMRFILDHLKSFEPKTLKVCVLIDKYERREADITIDYVCHTVQKGFLVGYGLDYAEEYRNLPEVYQLNL
jgi:hypoxanthine phosphoribosyltransferase